MKQSSKNNVLLQSAKPYATQRQYKYLLNLANSGASLEQLEESCSRNFPLVWGYMLKGNDCGDTNTAPYTPVLTVDEQHQIV